MRKGTCLILLALTGCIGTPQPPPPRIVVVLPLVDRTTETSPDLDLLGGILAGELAKKGGFRVVRPSTVEKSLAPDESPYTDPIGLAGRLNADAIVAAAVTEYDPYDPPRLGLSIQLLRTQARPLEAVEIDRIVRSATWRRGPVKMSPARAGHAVTALERIYDAHERWVREKIRRYTKRNGNTDGPFGGERVTMAVAPRYMRFVSHEIVDELLRVADVKLP